MKIAVLVKYIPNPAGVPELGEDHRVKREGVEGGIDPGDQYGVEAALQLAEASGGEVTAISMGPGPAMDAIRKALSLGAAKGILVTDEALPGADVLVTARVLAAAIRRESPDIVIAGVESQDGSTGTLPVAVAELLELPSLTFARKVEVKDDGVRIERQTETGYDVVECSLPALVTVTAGANEPRYPTLKSIMQSKQKPVETLSLSDLGLSAEDARSTQEVTGVEPAPMRQGGEVLEDASAAPARIVEILKEAKVI